MSTDSQTTRYILAAIYVVVTSLVGFSLFKAEFEFGRAIGRGDVIGAQIEMCSYKNCNIYVPDGYYIIGE